MRSGVREVSLTVPVRGSLASEDFDSVRLIEDKLTIQHEEGSLPRVPPGGGRVAGTLGHFSTIIGALEEKEVRDGINKDRS